MRLRLADGQLAVVTVAAVSRHFLVVDKRDYVESHGAMTGLAHVAGGDMITRFTADGNESVVMAADATRRQALVEMGSGDWFGCNRGDHELYRALTGDGASPDHQLRPVVSSDIGY